MGSGRKRGEGKIWEKGRRREVRQPRGRTRIADVHSASRDLQRLHPQLRLPTTSTSSSACSTIPRLRPPLQSIRPRAATSSSTLLLSGTALAASSAYSKQSFRGRHRFGTILRRSSWPPRSSSHLHSASATPFRNTTNRRSPVRECRPHWSRRRLSLVQQRLELEGQQRRTRRAQASQRQRLRERRARPSTSPRRLPHAAFGASDVYEWKLER